MTAEAPKSDMLSIRLSQVDGADRFHVDSVDISQPNFRHRLTFTKKNNVDAILAPQLADYVNNLLDRIDQDTMVFTEPEAVVDLPGLVLGRLRMLVHTAENYARQVIVRFSYFIGGVQAALKVDTHFQLPTVTHREALAVAVLHDICIPVFDIVSSAISGLFEDSTFKSSAQERLQQFSDVENDLLFYLELLKRYIVSSNDPEVLAHQSNVYRLAEPDDRGAEAFST